MTAHSRLGVQPMCAMKRRAAAKSRKPSRCRRRFASVGAPSEYLINDLLLGPTIVITNGHLSVLLLLFARSNLRFVRIAHVQAHFALAIAKPIFEPLTLAGAIAHCGRGAALRGRYILSVARLARLRFRRGPLGLAADALSLGGDLLSQPLKFLLELGHGCSPSLILRARFLERHKQQKDGIGSMKPVPQRERAAQAPARGDAR
jgi:hypothetical protein